MGALTDKTDMFICVYHTNKISINIFRNLEKWSTVIYNDRMRIVKCEKCGAEVNVRSPFAYMTYNNHKKVCEKS
jgi:hypothetical protein